jgi:hypothetical protein
MPNDNLPTLQHKLLVLLYQGATDPRYKKPYADLTKGGFIGEAPGNRYRWYVTQKGAAYCQRHRMSPTKETL